MKARKMHLFRQAMEKAKALDKVVTATKKLSPKIIKEERRDGFLLRDSVTVSLASMPARVETLQKVVSSLLPQVDKLNVYLNNYVDVPSFLNHKKIEVARSQDHGDLKDNAKFWWAAKVRGYHLTCDDDIIYPANYVEEMIGAIERYERKAIISCYGLIIHPNFKKLYTTPGYKCHPYNGELKSDQAVHIPGTGVMGYHSDGCSLTMEHFPKFVSADMWVGIYAQGMQIPVICMAHKKAWLPFKMYEDSIYEHSSQNKDATMNTCDLQTELILSQQPWKLNRPLPDNKSVVSYTNGVITVIMAAWQAEAWIEESIRSILSQDLPVGWTLELLIGTDGCDRTQKVCEKFYEDDRVGFVHFDTNRGTYIVFNDLLGLSQGELVARFDADDLMFPNRLFAIIKEFENPEVDLVNTWYIYGDEKPRVMGGNKQSAPNPPHMGVWAWRRNILEKLGSFEPWKCAADYEILMQADLAGLKRKVLPHPMSYYRRHSGSLCSNGETKVGGKLRNDYNKEIDRRRQNKSVREPFVPRKVDGDFQGALWVPQTEKFKILPKIIHQLWIGPNPVPTLLLDSWRRLHPGWEYRLWTERELEKINFINQAAIDALPSWDFAGKCDIMRYEILYHFGGIYVDADSYCLKSLEEGDFLNQEFTCYVGKDVSDRCANGYMGCLPKSRLMEEMINNIKKIPLDIISTKASTVTTATFQFTETINKLKYPIRIYPDWVFCPVHLSGRVTPNWQTKKDIFAIQYWGSTYIKKSLKNKKRHKERAVENFITTYCNFHNLTQKAPTYKEAFYKD